MWGRLRAKWRQFREEWAATEIPQRKQPRFKPVMECRQLGCTRSAERDAFCLPCWGAVFGGAC
jgi:hypothetical protein